MSWYDYTSIDNKVKHIIQTVCSYSEFEEHYIEDEIWKAYIYARDAHEGDFRHSWDPYILHPVEATEILLTLKPDILSIQACLLHDVIEDTPRTAQDIEKTFWKTARKLCEWLEKVSNVKYKWVDRAINTLRKMFVSMADDVRVIFIKLADRLHNMQTLQFHPKEEKRRRIAKETLEIYAPIADRLWLHSYKDALQEECFKVLEPEEYKKIKQEYNRLKLDIQSFRQNVKYEIRKSFKEANLDIDYEIDFRVKSIYSIYTKIKKKHIDNIWDIYDIFWIRITTNTVSNCYNILWIIHNKWKPIPKKIKDYIALPKPNWYQSLHTTVIWLLPKHRQQWTEIQIRTYEMHTKADVWIAAHFEYKEKWSKIAKDLEWIKELKDIVWGIWNEEFFNSLELDVFMDRIFAITPKWDPFNLPKGSTPVDFAYNLHSDIWNHISWVKVNWKVAPLDKKLENWDVVEVLTDKTKSPSPFWMSFVKTNKARQSIKTYLKKEDREKLRDRGLDMINKYLVKSDLPELDDELSLISEIDGKEHSFEERQYLIEQVWSFTHTPWSMIKKILKSMKNSQKTKKEELADKKKDKWTKVSKLSWIDRIIIWWDSQMKYSLAKCCEPVRWDKLVAYVTSKWTITVHHRGCSFIWKKANKNRLLPAFWEWEEPSQIRLKVSFELENKKWIFKDIVEILYEMSINTVWINLDNWLSETVMLDLDLLFEWDDYLLIDAFFDKTKYILWDNLVSSKIIKIKN